ncbi:hypothetical protein JCM16303_002419 [Sporobolomyces ruberrimus]
MSSAAQADEGGEESFAVPALPISAKAKGKQKAKETNELSESKRKRLACEVCRIRRVRCEWQESGSCLACIAGEFEMIELEKKLKSFDIGGAMTFQMIERSFKHTPPMVPGLPTVWFKQYVRTCAGVSKEREIAAEVLCAALVAGASAFTDHARIVGSVSPDMPASNPSRCLYNYSSFIPFGQARSEPVLALSFQSRQIFEDSTLRHRPSTEAIICLIVMDWMANLTREGAQSIPGGGDEGNVAPMQGERKIDTEYAEVLCRSYRTLMMGRRSEIKEKDLELLKGPVNAYLLSLDARNAAVTGEKAIFRDIDISPLFPQVAQACATPLFDFSTLGVDRDCWQELGKQLLPLVYATASLYRNFLQVPVSLCDSVALLEPIWTQIDLSLSNLALLISSLPFLLPSSGREDPLELQYDLESIVQTQQLHLAQLDLLVHQKIIQAFVQSSTTSIPPSPVLLQNYSTSRSRVQDVFRLAAGFARNAIETSSWVRAREVVETLYICSAWTGLGKTETVQVNVDLINELGITLEMGLSFEQCLALAAWSSPSAASQRENLLFALTSTFGPLPENTSPSPPITLPPPPRPLAPLPLQQNSGPLVDLQRFKDEDFQLDLSFLDDFAREHGIPIENDTGMEVETGSSDAPPVTSETLLPIAPLPVDLPPS